MAAGRRGGGSPLVGRALPLLLASALAAAVGLDVFAFLGPLGWALPAARCSQRGSRFFSVGQVRRRALDEERPSQAAEEGEDEEDIADYLWLSRFTALEKSDRALSLTWNKFCMERGEPTSPRMHSGQDLQNFIDSYEAGEFPQLEMTTQQDVASFNDFRRENPSARWHWLQYCAERCYGIRSVKKVTAEMLRGFLENYELGQYPDVDMATRETVGLILELHKRDEKYRKAWQDFVASRARGVKDPRAMPDSVASQFILDVTADMA